jgi:hypothetical protein
MIDSFYTGGWAQVVERKALSSILSTEKRRKNLLLQDVHLWKI